MLKPISDGGLGFKPEFVAQVVRQRLRMSEFVFNTQQVDQVADVQQILQVAEEKQSDNIAKTLKDQKLYQPSCMFDFGEQRAEVRLEPKGQDDYKTTGRATSPTNDMNTGGSPFSFVRGNGADTYYMPDGQITTNLPARFRQYLQFACPDDKWQAFNENSKFLELPQTIQFLVGLQFGQINVGTWNPFTLAAKKYFALQTEVGVDQFFWKDAIIPQLQQTHDAMLLEAFGELMTTLGVQQQRQLVAQQFEFGLLAYYTINMEILSRVCFDGNDIQNCQIQRIYRF